MPRLKKWKSFIITLETIDTGPFWKSPKRLQAMKLRLQKYDITVKYHKRKPEMHIADTLSRAYLPVAVSGKEKCIIDVNVIQHISVSPTRI